MQRQRITYNTDPNVVQCELVFDIPAPVLTQCPCIACHLRFSEEPHASKLCSKCRSDLDRTFSFAYGRLEQALELFDEALAKESEADQARYDHVLDEIIKGIKDDTHFQRVQRGIQVARGKDDGLARILQAKERCDATADEVQQVYAVIELVRKDLNGVLPAEALPEALQASLLDQAKSKATAILRDPRKPAEAARREVMHVPEEEKQAFRDWIEAEIGRSSFSHLG